MTPPSVSAFEIIPAIEAQSSGSVPNEREDVYKRQVKNGVEVWSAMEGQQRFDNHVDKLMNYIRYWQASGESLKTSKMCIRDRSTSCARYSCVQPFASLLRLISRPNAWKSSRLVSWYLSLIHI